MIYESKGNVLSESENNLDSMRQLGGSQIGSGH